MGSGLRVVGLGDVQSMVQQGVQAASQVVPMKCISWKSSIGGQPVKTRPGEYPTGCDPTCGQDPITKAFLYSCQPCMYQCEQYEGGYGISTVGSLVQPYIPNFAPATTEGKIVQWAKDNKKPLMFLAAGFIIAKLI